MNTENPIVSKMFIDGYIKSIIKEYMLKIYDDNSLFDDGKYQKIQLYLDIIKKIDNVDCKVMIEVFKDGDTYLSIRRERKHQSFMLYDNYKDQYRFYSELDDESQSETDYVISINQLKHILKKIKWTEIINTIVNYKYNHILDKFIDYDVSDTELKNMGYEFEDCSICYESTTYRDINNHYICRVCFSKLKSKKCPLCRLVLDRENTNLFECGCNNMD